MCVKLLTEHNLEFLNLKGGCTGSSESTLVKMPHCWISHVTAHITCQVLFGFLNQGQNDKRDCLLQMFGGILWTD